MPTDRTGLGTTYVVILNWNGWADTIACLTTLFASRGVRYRVVVCDNHSTDQSLARIADWADGRITPAPPPHPRLAALLRQHGVRPGVTRLSRAQAEAGGCPDDSALVLIDNEANLGFAAGNNVGLRYALRQPDMDCVWLLNNDTLVAPDCLHAMRETLALAGDVGVCGSIIHFFDHPEVIQAIGGNSFNFTTGIAGQSVGRYQHEDERPHASTQIDSIDYLSGCSMLIPRAALEQVGLLNDAYFLYYEEIDWFTRNQRRYPTLVADQAHLYHREGSAIGSPTTGRRASRLSDHHMFRSRVLFMCRYFPKHTAYVAAGILKDMLKRCLTGQVTSLPGIVNAAVSGWRDRQQ